MCGQHNVRVTAGDTTGQNTNKGHTSSPRIEIKISDPAGNRTGPEISLLFTLLQSYNPNVRGSDACRGSNKGPEQLTDTEWRDSLNV